MFYTWVQKFLSVYYALKIEEKHLNSSKDY